MVISIIEEQSLQQPSRVVDPTAQVADDKEIIRTNAGRTKQQSDAATTFAMSDSSEEEERSIETSSRSSAEEEGAGSTLDISPVTNDGMSSPVTFLHENLESSSSINEPITAPIMIVMPADPPSAGDSTTSLTNPPVTPLSSDEEEGPLSPSPLSSPTSSPAPVRRKSILKVKEGDTKFLDASRRRSRVLPQIDMATLRTSNRDETQSTNKEENNHSVEFHVVQIREYQQTMGDNPSVSYGTPIMLDWPYEEMEAICVHEYEASRGPRRMLRQMMVNHFQRRHLLSTSLEFSMEDIKQQKRAIKRIQHQRYVTQQLLPLMFVEDAVESSVRKLKRLLVGKNGKKSARTF